MANIVPMVSVPSTSERSGRRAAGQVLRLTRIELENWRNFQRAAVDLSRRAFIVGPNASGKSNFLDAFRFLNEIVSVGGGLQAAISQRGGISRLRSLLARQNSDIVLRTTLGTDEDPRRWQYELVFNLSSRAARAVPVVKMERAWRDGELVLDRPDDSDKIDRIRLRQTALEQIAANVEFRPIADLFQSIRYLHIVPQLVRDPDRSVGRLDDPYGGDFLETIARTPKREQETRLKRITDALKIAVPQLADLKLERDKASGKPHLIGKYAHWRPQGAWQREDQFSDGTLRLIGLLWAILDVRGPLLLEEPELSLNEAIVRQIPSFIYRMQQRSGRQVLLSTHADEMFIDSGIGADEVLLIRPTPDGSTIVSGATVDKVRAVLQAGDTLAEALRPLVKPPKLDQLSLFAPLE
ncbi:MAG TPA: AAA family ATPase [Candidatus Sulfotelmatobacter sp.]|nr:AAA family ATPase [Candidatus Sulfotelmatobacter sp.]